MKLSISALLLLLWACQLQPENENTPKSKASADKSGENKEVFQEVPDSLETAYFASGCFWCVEAIYESVRGVEEAVSGYAGGSKPNPTYREVSRGQTNHAEAVKVIYNPNVVDFKTLVRVYYGSQNPTTVNGQAPDFGKQYRSIIFYQNADEEKIARAAKDSLANSGEYEEPIATEIKELDRFYRAEAFHQDYEHKNPNDSYIRNVSIPRLKRFQRKFPGLLKDSAKH